MGVPPPSDTATYRYAQLFRVRLGRECLPKTKINRKAVPMFSIRLTEIIVTGLDSVATAAGEDAAVLRLENLDTDIPAPML